MNILKQHLDKFPILILNISGFTVETFILDANGKSGYEIEIMEKSDILPKSLEFSADLEKNLEKTVKKAVYDSAIFTAKKRRGGIKSCFLALSSPWYVSLNKTFKINEKEPFFFDKNTINNILNDKNNLFSEKMENNELKFLETEMLKIKLNGYETKKPFGKKIKSAEMYFYVSAAKKDFFRFINDILKKELHLDSAKFLIVKTLPSILFNFLKNKIFDGNGLFLFFLNENAELILIQENCVKEVVSINKGYNFFIRGLMTQGKSFYEAESWFIKYQNDDLENKEKEKCGKIIKIYEEEWKKSFNNLLARLTADYFLPQNLYLFSSKPVSQNIFLDNKSNLVLKTDFLENLNNAANNYKTLSETSSYLIVELLKNNLL